MQRVGEIQIAEIGKVSIANSAALLRLLAEFSKAASCVYMKLHNSTVSLDHRITKLHDMYTKVLNQYQPANSGPSTVSNDQSDTHHVAHDTEIVVNWGIKLSEVWRNVRLFWHIFC